MILVRPKALATLTASGWRPLGTGEATVELECCAYFAGNVTPGELRLSPTHVLEELAESPHVRLSASFVPVVSR